MRPSEHLFDPSDIPGLEPTQQAILAAGLNGKGVTSLELPRSVYDAVQATIEQALAVHLQALPRPPTAIAYQNTLPSGAMISKTHLRRAFLRQTLGLEFPIAIAVFSRNRLMKTIESGQFQKDEQEALAEFLRERVAHNRVSMYDDSKHEDRDCMAVDDSLTESMLFEGPQLREGDQAPNTAMIHFGEKAQRKFKAIADLHAQNMRNGRGTRAILEMIA